MHFVLRLIVESLMLAVLMAAVPEFIIKDRLEHSRYELSLTVEVQAGHLG